MLEESETVLTKVLLILKRWTGSDNTQRGSETLIASGVLFMKHQQINHGFLLALIENVIFFLILRLYLSRNELDNTHKSKTWKIYSPKFAVEVYFDEI